MRTPWRISSFSGIRSLAAETVFGKIYTVTQQLNTLQPQEIYRKTIQVMEDILENHSLTIYHLEKGYAFARLTAASSGLQPAPARSLAVDKYIDVFRAIEQDGVWVNRTFAPDLPMYAAGDTPERFDRSAHQPADSRGKPDDTLLSEPVPHPVWSGRNRTDPRF